MATFFRAPGRAMLAVALLLAVSAPAWSSPGPSGLDYEAMARRAVDSLKLSPGERVLLRFDPDYFEELVPIMRRMVRAASAVDLGALEYTPTSILDGGGDSEEESAAFEKLIEAVDVYIWLPVRFEARTTTDAERRALARWLDSGGSRRQIHFHWSQGSVLADGLAGHHSEALDRMYAEALDVDYESISETQERALVLLRTGTVRVRTPAGTDLRFRIGTRPFNKQDGDASAERTKTARIRIDRETELPCGVLRVAPLEETVRGRLVIPEARMQGKTARNIQFVIKAGRITSVSASENVEAVEEELAAGGDAALQFREFALGFNPKLNRIPGSDILPYFGYGAGVVRMSLGDNEELGGAVRGAYRRWFFFPDTTVEVDGKVLVRDGQPTNELAGE